MLGKDGRMRFNYNPQIAVDSHSGIIISPRLSNNPTDHYELIPLIKDIESKYGQLKPGTQIFADNGYSTDENIEYLKNKNLDGYIASRKLSRKAKKNIIKMTIHFLRIISSLIWKKTDIFVHKDKY